MFVLFVSFIVSSFASKARWGENPAYDATFTFPGKMGNISLSVTCRNPAKLGFLGLKCQPDDGCGGYLCEGQLSASKLPATVGLTFVSSFTGSSSLGTFLLYAGNFYNPSPKYELASQASGKFYWVTDFAQAQAVTMTLMAGGSDYNPLVSVSSFNVHTYVC